MEILLWVLIILLVISILISMRTQKSMNEKIQILVKELDDKKLEVERDKSAIWKRNQEIQDLRSKLADVKKEGNADLDIFSVNTEEVERILRVIDKDYSVTINSKKYLLKIFIFFLITNKIFLTIDDIKQNKKSLKENTSVVRKYVVYSNVIKDSKERIELGNSLFSLILYHKEKKA